jgi:hypothetical protein
LIVDRRRRSSTSSIVVHQMHVVVRRVIVVVVSFDYPSHIGQRWSLTVWRRPRRRRHRFDLAVTASRDSSFMIIQHSSIINIHHSIFIIHHNAIIRGPIILRRLRLVLRTPGSIAVASLIFFGLPLGTVSFKSKPILAWYALHVQNPQLTSLIMSYMTSNQHEAK